MSADFSIECAIPYVDDVHSERNKYLTVLGSLVRHLDDTDKTYTRTLLVDDVTNGDGLSYDLDAYVDALADTETTVLQESILNDLADSLYVELSRTMSAEELTKLKSEKGYSSPFYIAVWTLVRLGYLKHPDFPENKVAAKIINILPEEWREGEEISMAILSKTKYLDIVGRVEYIYA